ncbi:MAG: hypothetical protein AAFY34_14680 [Pseudomonadota bacterium]
MTVFRSRTTISILAALVVCFFGNAAAAAKSPLFEVGPEGSGAPLYIKHDASIDGLAPEMAPVGPAITEAFRRAGIAVTPVVTSGSEFLTWRQKWSKHLTGEAVDIRGRNLSRRELEQIVTILQDLLGDDFDVVLEWHGEYHYATHVHVERDLDAH